MTNRPDFVLLFAVSFHKLPEGLTLALLLLGAGYTRSQAFWLTLVIEPATEAGALLGLAALRHAPLSVLGLIFANVGGGFVYLIASTLGLFTKPQGAGRTLGGATQFALSGTAAFTLTATLILTLDRLFP